MELPNLKGSGHTFSGNSVSGNSKAHYGDIHGDVTNNYYQDGHVYIGLTGSLSGLRALTAAIHAQLSKSVADSTQDDVVVDEITSQVATSNSMLQTFGQHLARSDIVLERAALIGVDHVITLLANAVVLFDNLRSISSNRQSDGHLDAEQPGLVNMLERLRAQNAAWKLQMDLLDQNLDAAPLQVALEHATHSLLLKNCDLQKQMDHFQQQIDHLPTWLGSDNASLREPRVSDCASASHADLAALNPADSYIEDLNNSWVYRRNEQRSEEVMSIVTSIERDYAWSEISKLTFANTSILSVIALPVRISELEHGGWYQDAETELVAATLPPIPRIAETSPSPGLSRRSNRGHWARPSKKRTSIDKRPPEGSRSTKHASKTSRSDPPQTPEQDAERLRRREARKAQEMARIYEEERRLAEEEELRRIRHEARRAARKAAEAEATRVAIKDIALARADAERRCRKH